MALTAHALLDQREDLLPSGFDRYVTKPVTLAGLEEEEMMRGLEVVRTGYGQ